MPRPLRFVFEDAWYHVMNRGIAAQDIFKTKNHRQLFLKLSFMGRSNIGRNSLYLSVSNP